MSERKTRRYDAELAKPKRTSEGWLHAEARFARVGTQRYENADGSERIELRLPEEVFAAKSRDKFPMCPFTNTHPVVLLDATNTRREAVGSVGPVREDGDWLVGSVTVWDADTIRDIEAGRSQISVGYSCISDETRDPALVARWGRYDAIQRDIDPNHVAAVDIARAGPGAAMRLDSAGNAVLASDSDKAGAPAITSTTENKKMKTLRIDGLSIDVNDGNADTIQTAIDRALAAEKARADSAIAAEKQRADAADKMRADADKAKADAEKAHADFLAQVAAFRKRFDEEAAEMVKCDKCAGKGEMDGAKCDACEGKGEVPAAPKMDTPELVPGAKADGSAARRASVLAYRKRISDSAAAKSARETRARAMLEQQAKGVLGDAEKFDGKSDTDVKRLVVLKLAPTAKLDGKSETEISARYDAEIERVEAQRQDAPGPLDLARLTVVPPAGGRRLDGKAKQAQAWGDAYKTQPVAK